MKLDVIVSNPHCGKTWSLMQCLTLTVKKNMELDAVFLTLTVEIQVIYQNTINMKLDAVFLNPGHLSEQCSIREYGSTTSIVLDP